MMKRRIDITRWMTEAKGRWLLAAALLAPGAFGACGGSSKLSSGSETNWLERCDNDSDCGSLSCLCSVCTLPCHADGDCGAGPTGSTCALQNSVGYEAVCGSGSVTDGLCLPLCEEDSDCGAGANCVSGVCRPRASGLTPIGGSCTTAAECASAICEGQGCGPGAGVCADPLRPCLDDVREYCSCDGRTLFGSSGCPGGRYLHEGACESLMPNGSACSNHDECESGTCEGQGCDPGEGVCASRDRACTDDIAYYCGCNGQTFSSSGSCPGDRYEHTGTCDGKRPPGYACETHDDCSFGICEGQGCGPGEGECAEAERACSADIAAYCGCDGVTFTGSGTCPGGRYQHTGACESLIPNGSACSSHDECESGICEGRGCDPGEGVCASRDRGCTDDIAYYCGCDGQTFSSSGSCPGDRYEHTGTCDGKRPPGYACETHDDCSSGICEGQGCGPGEGECAETERPCTGDIAAYCGCDGVTFAGSGTCPGGRYQHTGACEM
jgi:hypothetical protein